MDTTSLYFVIAIMLVLLGLAGLILPALPGVALIFLGLSLGAWADGFQSVHWGVLIVLGALTLLSFVLDFIATALGAGRVGASRLAIIGALIGTLAGLFFNIVGLIIGPFIGALAGEILHRRSIDRSDVLHATKIGLGTWLGIVFGTVLKLALAFLMIGLFFLAWWL